MKRHKDSVNSPTRNGEAQVFVLPPELLEKLGIQLSNITCPPRGFADNSIVGQSTKDNAEDMHSSVDGSSILETANLMKQSVFMSPTFISTAATETTDELNIHNIVTETKESAHDDNEQLSLMNVVNVNHADKIDLNGDINPTYNAILSLDGSEKYQSIKEYEFENGDVILTNVSHENHTNTNIDPNSNKISSVDDHADEAYSSDGSNSNSGTCSEITNNNFEAALKQVKPSNKIKILSEQIINHSDLDNIQNSRIQKIGSSCFLIPVNTIVTGKVVKEHLNNQLQQNIDELCSINNKIGTADVAKEIVEDSLSVTHSESKVPGVKIGQNELCNTTNINTKENKKYDTIKVDATNNLEIVIHNDTVVKDSLSVKHSELMIPGVKEETNNYSDNKYIDENKIKDVRDVSNDKKLKVKAINDTTKEIVTNTEISSSESKLCIQGVEKPGGTHENKTNRVLKTYQRTNIRKRLPELPRGDTTDIVDSNILPEDVIDLDNINMHGSKNANKFCICSDFGILANYDIDTVYEHIHFCDHYSVGCNLETFFSMYDDTSSLRELNIMEDVNDETVEETVHNICWLSLIRENNDETEEGAITESITDASNSSPGQPRRSNRKRKSATQPVTQNVEPKSKKTVECGVCGLILSEAEWNKHKDSEHNLIAWKDGQAIDLKNNGLLKKLDVKLKYLGVLKCTFCKTDIKYLPKFVQHVKRCIKRKVEKNTSITINSETLSKNVLEKKDAAPKLTLTTRRSSRNLSSGTGVSDISIDISKSKLNHGHIYASSENIISTSKETDMQCELINSATCKQIEKVSIASGKYLETSLNSVERDGVTSKSARKSVDLSLPKSTKKASGLEDSAKSKKMSIGVVSCTESIVKSLDVERAAGCTRQSKTLEPTIKSTDVEVTSKQKRMTLDLSSKTTEIEDTPKSEVKGTPKPSRRTSDGFSKATKHKYTPKTEVKVSPKAMTASNDGSKAAEIQYTPKDEVKDTPKSTRKSTDIASKTSQVVESSKSTRKSLNVEVTTVAKLAQEGEASSKTTIKSIDDAGHPKSILRASTTNVANTDTKSKSIDASNKSTSKPVEAVGASAKCIQKSIHIEKPSTSRKLKDVDLFSSPTTRKSIKIENQPKSTKQSKDATATLRTADIETTANVSSKRPRKSLDVEDSNKLTKKSIDTEVSSKINRSTIDAETKGKEVVVSSSSVVETSTKSKRKSVDAHVCSKVPRHTDKGSKETKEVISSTPLKETKNNTPSKSKTNHSSPSNSKKRSSDMTKSETIFTNTESDINPKFRRKSNIVSIEVPPVDVPQEVRSVEIEIPVQSAKTATADNTSTSKTNTPEVNDPSGFKPCSKINSTSTSEDLKKSQPEVEIFVTSIKQEVLPKCGVCNQQVEEAQWFEHIAKEHDYLAWRDDEPPLDLQNDEEIRGHLYAILKANGPLKCSKCQLSRKYAKSFITHIRSCNGFAEDQGQMDASTASTDMDTTQDIDDIPLRSYPRGAIRNSLQRSVICGVCNETVLENKWIDHIRMEHKYLAWKKGEPPLDLNDDVAVKIFLQNISKYNGGLICSKCGTVRSYVKKWMDHEAICKGNDVDESMSCLDSTFNESSSAEMIEIEILPEIVKCAKCGEEMPSKAWIDHIEKEHNYLAWIEGQPPLDESNPEAVSAYLHAMVKKRGMLYCVKCGVTRKYPKAFLTHVSACEISGFKREDFYVEVSGQAKPGEYECAVCHETGLRKDWKKHAMSKHYNVAWMAGEIPINLKNPYAVEKYIKEYRTKHNLICKVCGASRASCYGFYAHILTCGKTEEELEHLMEMCDICNNKFLCIYRNQHRAMHKEQMIKKEKKERDAIKAEEESVAKAKAKTVDGEPMGKRRAAEKAKKVMEKYTSNIQDGSHVCLSCHIEFDNEALLKDHECKGSNLDEASDSDVSVKVEGQEESDDDMEDVDSSISDEEGEDPLKRKRQPETIPKIVLPFKVKDFNYYLAKSFENFCELHYTSERLFNNWHSNDYTILSEDESSKYLPSLLESCKLRVLDDQWDTYQRFEARKKKDTTIFTGASIRCMQWVPHHITEEFQDHFLSVACFRDSDCPRYGKDELPEHPGMLQIWNMGRFMSLPKFEMGLAHDYGTIWAMSWCPSGARDDIESEEDCRLGLLAIACSNGCAYVLSVPRFRIEEQDKPIIFKLKPVAELRLSANPKQPPYRIGYQATSIFWSPQKGHDVVIVGYADGTTAMYDLNTESPFLRATEDGVDIFYPFQDALTENSTITGVALCASEDLHRAVGGVASSSVTGATMAGWPRGPLVRSHLAASSVSYMPNWPAALLCSDDVLTMKSTNEMEWWGGGRRLGGACAGGACARCGRACLAAPPFVRVLRAHPAYPELKKQIVATMKMVPIARKRKLVNDDLGMIVEPLTYDETIKKYGLEFKTLPKKDQNVASKLCDNAEQCAERFPLSDMPAVAFCPSAEHHSRLAIASHAGFIFTIST